MNLETLIKNYKKHPVLATIIVLLLAGVIIYGLITANKGGDEGGSLGVTPMATETATPTAGPTSEATPTEAATPTAEPTSEPTKAPTDAVTPTQAAVVTDTPTPKPTEAPTSTPTPKPTKTPTPTVTPKPTKTPTPTVTPKQSAAIDEDGWYYDKDSVALYIHTYGHLPGNYITKKEAEALGWSGGSVDKYAKGKAIGGDYFGNYEGLLPKKSGRKYTECDIDTKGKSRGAKRIIFSNDGLIFYTDDHYETFTQLY